MTPAVEPSAGRMWVEYYDRFPYFSAGAVRDGCHPRVFEHGVASLDAVVLCHGLTDSPHFLDAIAAHFHRGLGCDVYLPLLHCHGLRDPAGMEGVELEEWKANVAFAVDTAGRRGGRVSVGGLSTGGTLAFYAACTHPRVTGDLYLFSAALDLACGPQGFVGDIAERLLRTFISDLLDRDKPLIGENPYRYAHMDMDGARELARLIKETDRLLDGFDRDHPFPKRVFAAHSESDTTADIGGIRALEKKVPSDRFTFYVIPKAEKVAHACLVLKDPICAAGGKDREKVLEKANPGFDRMMAAVTDFFRAA